MMNLFESEFFVVNKLANGVYGLIEKERGKTGSNAGIIDLGNELVVFDTFLNIYAAEDLKRACLELTGKYPSYVVNSHCHTDHIIGNCLFPDRVKVISSKATRSQIEEARKELEQEKPEFVKAEQELKEKLLKATDRTEIANLQNELNFVSILAKPNVSIRVPDVSFEKELVLHGDQRSIHLIAFPIGHSSGDVLAYLPEDKICFTGDLLFAKSHPWIGNGDPEKFISILEELLEYEVESFSPGHGPIGTKKDMELEIKYIKEITRLVWNKKNEEGITFSVDDLSPEFKDWSDLCFQWNINFLLEQSKQEK